MAKMQNWEIKISAIILNYRNPQLTLKCVNTLLDSINKIGVDAEIIVVDNSASETSEALKKTLPEQIKLIENRDNLGFAKANNMGIRISRGEYILLLNNDVFVNPECLRSGVQYLNTHKETAIWSPRLVGQNGNIQISCARFPSLKGVMGEYLFGKQWDWYIDIKAWNEPKNVDAVVGAFMLMQKKVLEEVGLLDEEYFFNVEDIAFCKRVHLHNYNIVYDPRCSVIHLGGASQPYKWVNDPYMHKNRILYFKKNFGIITSVIVALIIRIGLLLRSIKNADRNRKKK